MHKTNIYLDIDGVILANENNAANYANEFIAYLVNNYRVYWLTTHVMDGNGQTAIDHIGHLFHKDTVELMKKIMGTSWSEWKTEAIDFSKPFIWLDDDCYDEEREALSQYSAFENWAQIDLWENPDQLKDLMDDFPIAKQPLSPHST